MKVKNSDIYVGVNGINLLMGSKLKLPIDVSWEIVKLTGELEKVATMINKMKNHLIDELGVPDEKTGQKGIKPGTPEAVKFNEQFDIILEKECDLPLEPIDFPLEMDGKLIQIEPIILYQLSKFIKPILAKQSEASKKG